MKKEFLAKILIFVLCFLNSKLIYAEVLQKETEELVYYLYVPSKYNAQQKYPLIVALHWSTGRGTDMIERWQEPAEKKGYIVACPNSRNSVCWDIKGEDGNILRMINAVIKDYSINQKRIFVTGFSGGGTYSYYLGFTYPDIFAASAPFAGSLKWVISQAGVNLSKVRKQIPIFILHGNRDKVVDISESIYAKKRLEKFGYEVKFMELKGEQHNYPAYISWAIINWFEKIKGK